MREKSKPKTEKEIRRILKGLNPDLKRLLELADDPGDAEAKLIRNLRSGARDLRVARRMLRKT